MLGMMLNLLVEILLLANILLLYVCVTILMQTSVWPILKDHILSAAESKFSEGNCLMGGVHYATELDGSTDVVQFPTPALLFL